MSADNIIRPKYGINEPVYLMSDNKIIKDFIEDIFYDSGTLFYYSTRNEFDIPEDKIFSTKEALIKYLQEND